MRFTHGFSPCDICGIGLGDFMFHLKRKADKDGQKPIDRWIKIRGEPKVIWNGGEVALRWLELINGDLEWVEKTITPKKVCWDCFEKYRGVV